MPDKDTMGHELFASRMADCFNVVKTLLDTPVEFSMNPGLRELVVTGIGTSEGHGQFLVHLINKYTHAHAVFKALSEFATPVVPQPEKVLVVFSQGMSPNAHLALLQRNSFSSLIFFTSQSKDDASSTEAERIFDSLDASMGNMLVRFPPRDEGELLTRVVGPMAGYIACIQFVQKHWPGSIPEIETELVLDALRGTEEKARSLESYSIMRERDTGFAFLACSPLALYLQNLQNKLMESIMSKCPAVYDCLSFAHGGFQQATADKSCFILLQGASEHERFLFDRAMPLLDMTGALRWHIKSNLPAPWDILEYEMALNHFVAQGMVHYDVNQKKWPGYGEDHSLYGIDKPHIES